MELGERPKPQQPRGALPYPVLGTATKHRGLVSQRRSDFRDECRRLPVDLEWSYPVSVDGVGLR
jgi:hypothetical protein